MNSKNGIVRILSTIWVNLINMYKRAYIEYERRSLHKHSFWWDLQRGLQKVSKICLGIVSAAWLGAIICVFIALPHHSWLWLISCFRYDTYSCKSNKNLHICLHFVDCFCTLWYIVWYFYNIMSHAKYYIPRLPMQYAVLKFWCILY